MSESSRCPQCGTELPDQTPQGVCPACLLKLGLSGAVPILPESLHSRPRRKRLLIAIAAVLGGVALVAAVLVMRQGASPRPVVVRFHIPVPEDADFAVSPDGTQLAYSGAGHLWVRSLDAFAARQVAGADRAQHPFWSPDGRYISFASEGKLKRVAAGGGEAQIVCEAPRFTGGVWSREDEILFGDGRMLYHVPAAGGRRQGLIEPGNSGQETADRWPQLLPGSKRFLFVAMSQQPEKGGIYAADSGRRTKVLPGSNMAAAAEGYLLVVRDGVLTAYPFDAARLQVRGDARAVRFAEPIRAFSVSGNTLAYRTGSDPRGQLTWFDRSGKSLGNVGEPGENGPVSISPNGRSVAVVRGSGVWLLDLERDTTMRFAVDGGQPTSAVWSPDGTRIAFGVQQAAGSSILLQQVNGAGQPETLLRTNRRMAVDSWSPDGQLILYDEEDVSGESGIWRLPLQSDHKPAAVLRSNFAIRSARLSPDGRWMAYVSNETGRDEIYVQSFPGPGGKWMISASGGTEPYWRRDGRELFYLSGDRVLTSVQTESIDQVLRPGIARNLFPTRQAQWYALSSDGSRFLFPTTPEDVDPSSVYVVLNWAEDLRR